MVTNPNVHTKEQIISGLHDVFDRTFQYCQDQDDSLFEKPFKEGKWSTAQNIEHLCNSTFPVAKGMRFPKLVMRTTFGTNNREEKDISQLYSKYKAALATGIKAPPKFSPTPFTNEQKIEVLGKFKYAKEKLLKTLERWDEKSLSKYIMPHPTIGKLTIREFMFFTIFHTEHHLNAIKKIA